MRVLSQTPRKMRWGRATPVARSSSTTQKTRPWRGAPPAMSFFRPTPASSQRLVARRSGLVELAVPVQEVAPTLVQVAGRERPAVLLQLLRRRLERRALQVHADLAQQPVALQEVARAA